MPSAHWGTHRRLLVRNASPAPLGNGDVRWFLICLTICTRHAVDSRPPVPLRLFELLWVLQREQDMQRRATLENTSNADLKSLIDMQLTKIIERDPELVLHAAQRLGWGLIPPNNSNPGDQAVLSSCSSHREALSRIH